MTKTKNVSVFSALVLMIASCFMLCACGENSNCYYTIATLPSGVQSVGFADCSNDENGNYLEKDVQNILEVQLNVGQELGTLKVLADGTEIPLTVDSTTSASSDFGLRYTGTYAPSKNFEITFSGATELHKFNTSFNLTDDNYTPPTDNYNIKVDDPYNIFDLDKNESNTKTFSLISSFKQAIAQASGQAPYGSTLKFSFWSNPVNTYAPSTDVLKIATPEFLTLSVEDNDALVFEVLFNQETNIELTLESLFNEYYSFLSMNTGGTNVSCFNSPLFNCTLSTGEFLKVSDLASEVVLNVECLKYDTLKTYYDQMEFRINNEAQTYTIDQDTKTFSIVLKKPFEYANPDLTQSLDTYTLTHNLAQILAENGLAKVFHTVTLLSNDINNVFVKTNGAFYGKNGENFECIVYDFDGSTNLYVENVQDIYLEILLSDSVVLESVEINSTNIDASKITTVNESGFIHAYIKLPENCVPNTVFVQTAS